MLKPKIMVFLLILSGLTTYVIYQNRTKATGLTLGQEQISKQEKQQAEQMTMLIKQIVQQRAEQTPKALMKRFNQVKTHGCFKAQFTVKPNLPTQLAQGLFSQPTQYPAILRFANASKMDDREKDIHGLSIKIFSDKKDDKQKKQQDFLFNTAPSLFAANPQQFHQFIKANAEQSLLSFFIAHPKALINLVTALDTPTSLFNKQFYSATPSRHGLDQSSAVKYSAKPCKIATNLTISQHNPNYLRTNMATQLQKAPICFEFMAQQQTNPDTMPIEDPSIEWPQAQSPYITIATITIEPQDFTSTQNINRCEQMSFNPWNTLPEHQPLGGINRVRKMIYQQLGEYRSQYNQKLK